jgi:phosphopantothenoylcysteine decarboxylase
MEKPAIIIAVTGGIAAFKSAALTSQLVQQGFPVTVVMTPSAEKFVGAATFRALTGTSVVRDLYDPAFPLGAHIELARSHSLLCVAPATANFIGKAANGIADDLLSTMYLCFTGRVVIAPAMNVEMWNHPAVKRNLQQLQQDGVDVIDPASGWLSCRVEGKGRMAEPEQIFQQLTGAK